MSIKKLSNIRKKDPFLQREEQRYAHPLPSREYVVQTLAEQGKPTDFDRLCALLDVTKAEHEGFLLRLSAMERNAQLMRNRKGAYILPERASLIAGHVEGHPDGYGFFVPDDGSEDLFLNPKQMSEVLHEDRVLARASGVDRRGRREGKIVEILERTNTRIVGRVRAGHGITVVVPENRRISHDILIPPDRRRKFKDAQVVMVEIIEPPSRHSQPIGRVVEVLGDYADSGMEIEIALRKHKLPFLFPKDVQEEAKAIPAKIAKGDLKDRKDLRALPLLTIDGESARDFDDAVFAEKKGRAWRLVVAIADVSHYVRPGSALDREAENRGNSVYFPRRVIPMLPEKLSNGLCSLNPDVDRLAMVCDMEIGASGAIGAFSFYPAVFRSKARLTYDKVWAWLSGAPGADDTIPAETRPTLQTLHDVFQALKKARAKRGAIDFETVETEMIFDDQGKIAEIVPVFRNDAHRLIEECMLAANVCASEFLEKHRSPCLYRIHEGPTPEKLEGLRGFLKEFGLALTGGDAPTAKDYVKLLEKTRTRPDAELLQTVMLRSLRQAVYSPENAGHFGLSYERYTHFTSPIRRYPDLIVHRSIKAALDGARYKPGKLDEIGLRCSMTERRGDEASRDVTNWLKCYYMRDRIGEDFDGTIAGVVPFGVFVALDGIYVEGLVHVSELGEDYFHFDATKHQMLGERSRQRYRLGDRLKVRLVRADLESGRIDFVLADPRAAGYPPRSAQSARAPEKTPAGKTRAKTL
ncbi:MAG: ribonuclease R [Candidatus Accumulibacter sp.]|jgi:ribonuclease R|nr:ribonuclease R [Accumulibacter sp.]